MSRRLIVAQFKGGGLQETALRCLLNLIIIMIIIKERRAEKLSSGKLITAKTFETSHLRFCVLFIIFPYFHQIMSR